MPDADVTFVLPGLRATGGIRAVFEVADRLGRRGVSAAILVPERTLLAPHRSLVGMLQRHGPGWLTYPVQRRAPVRPMTQSWFDLQTPIQVAGPELLAHLPATGAVIATSYRTAEIMERWEERAARGVYLLQGYESWDGPAKRVDRTWRAFDRLIVTSPGLAQRAKSMGRPEAVLAPYGVDLDAFTPATSAPHPRPVIGFHWDDRAFKGGALVVEALQRLRGAGVDLQARAFGLGSPGALSRQVDFVGPAYGEDLVAFYRSLDVFVSASRDETGPMTLPEAMACGIATISTDVGCVRTWSPDGSAISVLPGDPGAITADAISQVLRPLMEDPKERERLAEAGRTAIQRFGWDAMTDTVEGALRRWDLIGERRPRP